MAMMQGLKRWAAGGILLREVRGLRLEIAGLQQTVARIAAALELANAHQWPQTYQPDPNAPAVEIAYTDDTIAREFMEIELALTLATGQAPTEGQVMQEYERRHAGEGLPTPEGAPLGVVPHSRAERS